MESLRVLADSLISGCLLEIAAQTCRRRQCDYVIAISTMSSSGSISAYPVLSGYLEYIFPYQICQYTSLGHSLCGNLFLLLHSLSFDFCTCCTFCKITYHIRALRFRGS